MNAGNLRVGASQAKIAWQTYRDYGKGSGHPAGAGGPCLRPATNQRVPLAFGDLG
ncbi:MAG: hypothetical protein ABSE87_02405 [Terracidiphilus sp.]|jgi:uncharacterized protein with PIN domain